MNAARPPEVPPAPTSAPDFDRLAEPYRWLEYMSFGPILWRCRTQYLPRLADRGSALVLGDGDGRFTEKLLRSNLRIQIHAVDASLSMVACLERRSPPHQARLTTEVGDLRSWSPAQGTTYDLVVSHFFLDCLSTEEVAALADRLAAAMQPGALWLISDFAIPPTLFGGMIAAPVVAGLYLAFRWMTGLRVKALPNHAVALENAGWKVEAEKPQLKGLLISQLWRKGSDPI